MIYVVGDRDAFERYCIDRSLNRDPRARQVRRVRNASDTRGIIIGPDDEIVDLGGPYELLLMLERARAKYRPPA